VKELVSRFSSLKLEGNENENEVDFKMNNLIELAETVKKRKNKINLKSMEIPF